MILQSRDTLDPGGIDATAEGEVICVSRGSHNIPESFKAFCRMVSFTAAKTSRIFVVSVACVRLRAQSANDSSCKKTNAISLRVEVELSSVDLVEPPEQVFGRSVHVVAARIVWKIVPER